MRILGLTFAGTATDQRGKMTRFLHETFHLESVRVGGVEADLFGLPDGSQFAVDAPGGMGDTDRSIGFLVDDLEDALTVLAESGVEIGVATENAGATYVHFRAPDGQLYELIQRKEPLS